MESNFSKTQEERRAKALKILSGTLSSDNVLRRLKKEVGPDWADLLDPEKGGVEAKTKPGPKLGTGRKKRSSVPKTVERKTLVKNKPKPKTVARKKMDVRREVGKAREGNQRGIITRVQDYNGEGSKRNVLCPYYNICLDEVLLLRWSNFSCVNCKMRFLREEVTLLNKD